MTSLHAVRCTRCDGAVQAAPGKPLPACLFCGADATDLLPLQVSEEHEAPRGAVAFAVSPADAQERFVEFAGSSFWHPSDLRSATLQLHRLLLPAWSFTVSMQAHHTGLVSAHSDSGKRPVTGRRSVRYDQLLIVASPTLTQAELSALGPYDEQLRPFEPDTASDPFEVGELTRSAARSRAVRGAQERHTTELQHELGLSDVKVACVLDHLEGRPVLIPVYIGTFDYGDHPYRVLVNGQTGALVADAPTSLWKVAGIAAAVALVVTLLVLGIVLCLG